MTDILPNTVFKTPFLIKNKYSDSGPFWLIREYRALGNRLFVVLVTEVKVDFLGTRILKFSFKNSQ